jgi:hypothetical protein
MQRHIPTILAFLTAFSSLPGQPVHRLSISGVSAQELSGNGSSVMSFLVSVQRDTTVPAGQISVQYQASGGTATVGTMGCQPGIDVVLQPSAVTILATQASAAIVVTLCADNVDEADSESFTVDLFGAMGASIATAQATGTVLDDDPPPTIEVLNASAVEGGPGAAGTASFSVRLNTASGRAVTFGAASQGGGAVSGSSCSGNADFVATSGQFTIAAGQTTVAIPVAHCTDVLYEGAQTYSVTISNVQNATLIRASATGTIVEDDPVPTPSWGAAQNLLVTEGNAGTTTSGSIVVNLSAAAGVALTANVSGSGTATVGTSCAPGVDIVFSNAAFTWAAGDASPRTVTWQVCGDNADDEDTETLLLALSPGGQLTTGPATTTVQITDDDPTPTLTVEDLTITRPTTGKTATANVVARLSAASNRSVSLKLTTGAWAGQRPLGLPRTYPLSAATAGSSCTGSVDYITTAHVVSFPPGTTVRSMAVTICDGGSVLLVGKTSSASDEVFEADGTSATNASFAKATGLVVIAKL